MIKVRKIKKIITFIILFFINNVNAKEITTFKEYESEIQKFDLVILFVVPIIITVIGLYFYIKNNRKMKLK